MRRKRKPMDPAKAMAITCIITALAAVWCVVSGIIGITFKDKQSINKLISTGCEEGDFFEGDVSYSSDCILRMKHTINFIPTAYENYFIVISSDGKNAAVVRADKDFSESFHNGIAAEPVHVKGRVKETDYKVQRELTDITAQLRQEGISVSSENYYDFISTRYYVLRIILGILLILCTVSGIVMSKNQMNGSGSVRTSAGVFTIILCVSCVLMLHVMSMS